MLDDDLREHAARLALHESTTDAAWALVDRAMDEGIFLDAFVAAAYPAPWCRHEAVAAALRALLARRGIVVPEPTTALWTLIAVHVRRIADDRHDARVALQALVDDVYDEAPLRSAVTTYYGDGFDIHRLIGQHWSFDELEARPETSCDGRHGAAGVERLKARCRDEAHRWLRAHGG